jgi:exportin-2 (importin alpha re-exporter)
VSQNMLGVFQRLVATKAHDHEGFYILNALLESLPADVISPFLPAVRPHAKTIAVIYWW